MKIKDYEASWGPQEMLQRIEAKLVVVVEVLTLDPPSLLQPRQHRFTTLYVWVHIKCLEKVSAAKKESQKSQYKILNNL